MKNNKSFSKVASISFTALAISLGANSASAAGFEAPLQSASGLGNSYAGSVTGVHDISDGFYNPANLADVKKSNFVLSMSYLDLNIDSDDVRAVDNASGTVTGSENHDSGMDSLVPAFYFATPINDKTSFGISLTAPYALATEYDKNWVGRYQAIESSVVTYNFNPAVAYKLTDDLSIGAGAQIQYIKAVLTKAVLSGGNDYMGKFNGDDVGYGFTLGAKYQVSDALKLGIGYRSKIRHKLEGTTQVDGLQSAGYTSAATSLLTTPETLTFGGAYKLTDNVELLSDVSWSRWSRVRILDVVAPANATLNADDVLLNYKDSWKYSLGLNFQSSDNFVNRFGIAYEEGANSSAEFRSPRIPTGDRVWLSYGIGYKLSEDLKLDASYVHQFYSKTRSNVSNSVGGSMQASYQTSVNVVAVGVNWSF